MSKMKKIVDMLKISTGRILLGNDILTKVIDSRLHKEMQTIEEQIQELKNEEKKLRSKIRHESDEMKRKELEQKQSFINQEIKRLQYELAKCKDKITSDDVLITLGPVLVPLCTTKDTHSVIANITTIDESQIENRNVLQSSNMKDSHDKQSK